MAYTYDYGERWSKLKRIQNNKSSLTRIEQKDIC